MKINDLTEHQLAVLKDISVGHSEAGRSTATMKKAKILAEDIFGEPVLGFRCLPVNDPTYVVGEAMDNSMDWQDDECMGIELPGACSLSDEVGMEDAIEILKSYHGDDARVYIIAGDSGLYGQDENEVIISNPHVVGILK
jgi:hypothetical protein